MNQVFWVGNISGHHARDDGLHAVDVSCLTPGTPRRQSFKDHGATLCCRRPGPYSRSHTRKLWDEVRGSPGFSSPGQPDFFGQWLVESLGVGEREAGAGHIGSSADEKSARVCRSSKGHSAPRRYVRLRLSRRQVRRDYPRGHPDGYGRRALAVREQRGRHKTGAGVCAS